MPEMKRARIGLLLALGTWLLLPTRVAASCMAPPPIEVAIEEADVVFVGTVRELSNQNRTAGVEVHEVWRGTELPGAVTVHGGPDDPNMLTSADRSFTRGTTYLFVPSAERGILLDNACSSTTVWSDELAALRPDDARPAAGQPDDSARGGVPVPVIALGVGALALALFSAVAFRRPAVR